MGADAVVHVGFNLVLRVEELEIVGLEVDIIWAHAPHKGSLDGHRDIILSLGPRCHFGLPSLHADTSDRGHGPAKKAAARCHDSIELAEGLPSTNTRSQSFFRLCTGRISYFLPKNFGAERWTLPARYPCQRRQCS